MKQTAADRHISGQHKPRERYSTGDYDRASNAIKDYHDKHGCYPTRVEFVAIEQARHHNRSRVTLALWYDRYFATGTCRPRLWLTSEGKKPRNLLDG